MSVGKESVIPTILQICCTCAMALIGFLNKSSTFRRWCHEVLKLTIFFYKYSIQRVGFYGY